MITWTMILVIWGYREPAITNVSGFVSETTCMAAGNIASNAFDNYHARYICVPVVVK